MRGGGQLFGVVVFFIEIDASLKRRTFGFALALGVSCHCCEI